MPTTRTCPLVGAYFRPPAQAILKVLPSGAPLTLEREPSNQYDPNAIAVLVETTAIPESAHAALTEALATQGREIEAVLAMPRCHLGYVPKEVAATLRGAGLGKAELAFGADGKPQVKFEVEG